MVAVGAVAGNPWGRGEWKGEWGTGSRQWNTDAGRAVGSAPPAADGRFWYDCTSSLASRTQFLTTHAVVWLQDGMV